VLLKDNVNTNDMPNTGGSLSLAGYTPVSDAVITRRLRSAGAIILAKVNLHEFAIWVKRHCARPVGHWLWPRGGNCGGTISDSRRG
jgi:Asp-tRNA(Asn)/Glu-tRNA(Gln) amidotransferase A subunit family amidase